MSRLLRSSRGEVYAAPEGVIELRGFPDSAARVVAGRRPPAGEVGPLSDVQVEIRGEAVKAAEVVVPYE